MVFNLFFILAIAATGSMERYDYTGEDKDFPSMEACEAKLKDQEPIVAAHVAMSFPGMERGKGYDFKLICEAAGKPA